MLVSFFLRGNIKFYLKIYIGKTTLNTGFAGDWLKGEVTDWRSRKKECASVLSRPELGLNFPMSCRDALDSQVPFLSQTWFHHLQIGIRRPNMHFLQNI